MPEDEQALWLLARSHRSRDLSQHLTATLGGGAPEPETRPHRPLPVGLGTGKREQGQEQLTTATAMYEMGMTYWLQKAEAEMKDLAR